MPGSAGGKLGIRIVSHFQARVCMDVDADQCVGPVNVRTRILGIASQTPIALAPSVQMEHQLRASQQGRDRVQGMLPSHLLGLRSSYVTRECEC